MASKLGVLRHYNLARVPCVQSMVTGVVTFGPKLGRTQPFLKSHELASILILGREYSNIMSCVFTSAKMYKLTLTK